MMKSVLVFKRTKDNWHPPYQTINENLVAVKLWTTDPKPPEEGLFRVCVWGAVDFGMEKDFNDETEARNCYLELLSMDTVDIEPLKDLGFCYA